MNDLLSDCEPMATSKLPWNSCGEHFHSSSMLSYQNKIEHNYAQGISPKEYDVQGDKIVEVSSDSVQKCELMTTSDIISNTAISQHSGSSDDANEHVHTSTLLSHHCLLQPYLDHNYAKVHPLCDNSTLLDNEMDSTRMDEETINITELNKKLMDENENVKSTLEQLKDQHSELAIQDTQGRVSNIALSIIEEHQKRLKNPTAARRETYSADLRKFAITMHGFSPKAYR